MISAVATTYWTTYFSFSENNPEEEKDFAEENDSPEEETSYSLAEDNPGT